MNYFFCAKCNYQKHFSYLLFLIFLSLYSCQKSPTEDIINIIDKAEIEICDADSWDKMDESRKNFLHNLTHCLDVNHNGYRFNENSNEFIEISNRLDSFNKKYWLAAIEVNPKVNTNDTEIIAKFLALLKVMEVASLTDPDGFDVNKNKTISNFGDNEELDRNDIDVFEQSNLENDTENNQIKRNFNGIILGKSSKQELQSYLKENNLPYKIESDGNQFTIRQNNIYFGGIKWNYLTYAFGDDILNTIVYIKNGEKGEEKEIYANAQIIKKNLFNKYRQFYIPDDTFIEFSDGMTNIQFFYEELSICIKYQLNYSSPADDEL